MSELKNCPFCGGKANQNNEAHCIECTDCGFGYSVAAFNMKEIAEEWNTRTPDQSTQKVGK